MAPHSGKCFHLDIKLLDRKSVAQICNKSLKVNASYTPLLSHSPSRSPSAVLPSTTSTKRGTCELSKAQNYCMTPTVLPQNVQFWSHKGTFHVFKASKQPTPNRSHHRARGQQQMVQTSVFALWVAVLTSQVLEWSQLTQVIPGGSQCCCITRPLAQLSLGKPRSQLNILTQRLQWFPVEVSTGMIKHGTKHSNWNDKAWQSLTATRTSQRYSALYFNGNYQNSRWGWLA